MSLPNKWSGLPVVIFGSGGLAIETKGVIDDVNAACSSRPFDLLGFISESEDMEGKEIEGTRVICCEERFKDYSEEFMVLGVVLPFGNPDIKKKIYAKLKAFENIVFPNVIHPRASIAPSPNSKLGRGIVVCANVILTINVDIGDFVYLNNAAIISHSIIGEFTTVNAGVCVSGGCLIGKGCLIGSNASIKQHITVGDGAICGMGAIVVEDVEAGAVVVSDKARRLR